MKKLILLLALIMVAGLAWMFLPWRGAAPDIDMVGDAEQGKYVLHMGGCIACHTDEKNGGAFLAGGRALKTDFGTFYSSNITPDPEAGLGGWSVGDFVRAMKEGLSPSGQHYYPAFPYPSYTKMTVQDLVDLKAYLDSVEPVADEVRDHELGFPFSIRPILAGWKMLFFDETPFEPDPDQSASWNRGAYLVQGPAHCGECHSPRNILGGPDHARFLGGNPVGAEGKAVPNITPHEDGIGNWSAADIAFALESGLTPDYDSFGSGMGEVVDDSTSQLTKEDRDAMAEYLLSLPAIASKATVKTEVAPE
ncbi:MAG: c-type cytochrome [Geminicoccales bacterium]